jgi:hypothetical protein
MSISGLSAASAASYIPKPPAETPATTPATTFGAAAQTASATPAAPVQQGAPTQPSGAPHHHHHHGGGDSSGQSFDVTQSGTNTVANILSTLV